MKPSLFNLRNAGWMAISLLTLVMIFGLIGCGGGNGGQNTRILTPAQIAAINQSSNSITDTLTASADPKSDAALQAAKAFAITQNSVESAVITDGNLSVKYKGGGVEIWGKDTPLPITPPDISELNALARQVTSRFAHSRVAIGTKKAVIINALYNDPAFDNADAVLEKLHDILEGAGIDTTVLSGSQATIAALRGLQDNSLIIQLGHGGLSDGRFLSMPYAVQIGTEWSDDVARLPEWRDGRIVHMQVNWGKGTEEERKHLPMKDFVAVTGKFWQDAYNNKHLKDGLFFNLACSSSKYPSYRDGLKSVGVRLYSGWSEDQGKSYWTAYRILMLMADGKTMQQAVDTIPDWYKFDDPASFWYGPDAERGMTLSGINNTVLRVALDTPIGGTETSNRETTVSGQVLPVSLCRRLSVSVNGQSSAMPFNAEGYFSQIVGLRNGDNTIIVTAESDTKSVTDQVEVKGVFTPDVLYTALSWNTNHNDIDLHMVPVDGANGFTDDCYFDNMISNWGATLDVDDVDGFGPEHITARELPAGKYLLFVYYYDAQGQTTPATVSLAVSCHSNMARIFTLPAMSNTGDRWNVCYLNYPAGTIEPINEFIPVSRARNLPHYPPKN